MQMIQDLVEKFYNKKGSIQSLPGDVDLNFKLKTADGGLFIVKLMREGTLPADIDIQCAILLYLENRIQEIDLPKVIRSKNKAPFEIIELDGVPRILWILTWCPGTLFAHFSPHSESLAHSFGASIAHLTNGLEGFDHPAKKRDHRWTLTEALQSKHLAPHIQGDTKAIAISVFKTFEEKTALLLQGLPHSVIHNDANDYNVLVDQDSKGKAHISGIFDFGDLSYQPTICEIAVALAYVLMDQSFPLRVCSNFLKGYASIRPISENELAVLFDLIKTRLAVSISISSYRQIQEPDDEYITISQIPAKNLLTKLDKIPDALALAVFRKACGYSIIPQSTERFDFLKSAHPFPIMADIDFESVLDLSVSSTMLTANPESVQLDALTKKINAFMESRATSSCIGRYCESRRLYAAANFGASGHPSKEKRTNHLGIDIFTKAGAAVFAPFDGIVEIATTIDLPLDYGGMIILKHHTETGIPFYTLYGHLSANSFPFKTGDHVKAGNQIAALGEPNENGGWPPHLHLQLMIDLVGLGKEFPGVAYQEEIEIWSSLSLNPMLLFDVPDIQLFDASVHPEVLLKDRQLVLGNNLSLSYSDPLHIVSGYKQFLFDSHARTYLDLYNNVPHVGHQHPRVVQAIQNQVALLNTNTRYLHENILNYAKKLKQKLPNQLEVCYFTNSATEANELAIRMARTFTKRKDILVVESAYHGHTSTLIDISPYKHDGPGGEGPPDWVHTVPIADDYRGQFKRENPDAGQLYAKEVQQIIKSIEAKGKEIAGFIAETYPSVGGQIILPEGYLKEVYQQIRNHGGLCIADEVQTGFGRLGKSFWAFETQEVIPDIVILGKPIANGMPMGALITTKEIAEAFDNGMEYFSTFGGNPVSCAAAMAVLETVEVEDLQSNATKMGKLIMEQFKRLQAKYPLIGDVRGEGLFLGMELVKSKETLAPAVAEADYVVNRLKDFRILAGTDGPLHNVLKFRPSMVIEKADVDYFIEVLDRIFSETFLKMG